VVTGTIINIATVLVGGLIGMLFGSRLPERMRNTVLSVLGLFTMVMGVQMFLTTQNSLVVLAALLVGTMLGEWWQIEDGMERLGNRLKNRFAKTFQGQDMSRFVEGFLTASILFCIGPMTILGSIQDGLTGDYSLLAVKATLDGFAALAFASTMGIGVLFSTIVILSFQGGLSLLAVQAQTIATPMMMNEMSAAGGIILVGIALSNILNIKEIRSGNLLPALFLAPLFAVIFELLGIF